MRALVQRVREAKVTVDDSVVGQIGPGLLVLVGISHGDTRKEAENLASKVVQLRIFPDIDRKMNLSLRDIDGELLSISQFTLYGDTQKGNRPSYTEAARPGVAKPLYELFADSCGSNGIRVQKGIFQAHMLVESINDGPVTLLCEANSK